jgi:hypothetical protein
LLSQWLFKASEHQERITTTQIRERLVNIAKYFREREAHHNEWFKSIAPLDVNSETSEETLASQFYQGVSARYSHIQANLDVIRQDLLRKLDALFKVNKTCIVHGASGQGKTAFALRYLHSFASKYWCFQIKHINDRAHAINIAGALASHLKALDVVAYLYIDVSPRDIEWPDLIKALLDIENVKILVTIREEDLARIVIGKEEIGKEEIGNPYTLSVNLNTNEACLIYERLREKKVDICTFPSALVAWETFGSKGPLLEFVYFLTQTKSLHEKLQSQLIRLENEAIASRFESGGMAFLYVCAVATSVEARLQTKKLLSVTGIKSPRTIKLLEKEYLLRNSAEGYIEAIHPIRSRILANLLEDADFRPWIDAAEKSIQCIQEVDLEPFLLNAFLDKSNESEQLIAGLNKLCLSSWAGFYGVSKALLWQGLHQYFLLKEKVINDVVTEFGVHASTLTLLVDFANAMGEKHDYVAETMTFLGKNNPEKLRASLEKRKELLQDKSQTFDLLGKYLTTAKFPTHLPDAEYEWQRLGQLLIWVNYLKLNDLISLDFGSNFELHHHFSFIEPLAEFTQGLYCYSPAVYSDFMARNQDSIIELFQRRTDTLYIEFKEQNPVAHYIVPFDITGESIGEEWNELSVSRAKLLAMLFPENEKFGAVGYGHMSNLMEVPIDDANKPGMKKDAFPIEQYIELNSWWINLSNYQARPNDWDEFVSATISLRKKFIAGLQNAKSALNTYFRSKKAVGIFPKLIDANDWMLLYGESVNPPMLPKIAVDPWGFTSESNANNSVAAKSTTNHQPSRYSISTEMYTRYFDAVRQYTASLTNFFQQSIDILAINDHIGRAPEETHAEFIKIMISRGLSYSDEQKHLSVHNLFDARKRIERLQSEFRLQFQNITDKKDLDDLEKEERDILEQIWPLWYFFVRHPDMCFQKSPAKECISVFTRTQTNVKKKLANSLSELTRLTDIYSRIEILTSAINYEDKKTCFIQVELTSPCDFGVVLNDVTDQINKALCPLDPANINYYALSKMWQQFAVVPAYRSQAIAGLAWILPLDYFLYDGIKGEALAAWQLGSACQGLYQMKNWQI